jgi:hypothetical protein
MASGMPGPYNVESHPVPVGRARHPPVSQPVGATHRRNRRTITRAGRTRNLGAQTDATLAMRRPRTWINPTGEAFREPGCQQEARSMHETRLVKPGSTGNAWPLQRGIAPGAGRPCTSSTGIPTRRGDASPKPIDNHYSHPNPKPGHASRCEPCDASPAHVDQPDGRGIPRTGLPTGSPRSARNGAGRVEWYRECLTPTMWNCTWSWYTVPCGRRPHRRGDASPKPIDNHRGHPNSKPRRANRRGPRDASPRCLHRQAIAGEFILATTYRNALKLGSIHSMRR